MERFKPKGFMIDDLPPEETISKSTVSHVEKDQSNQASSPYMKREIISDYAKDESIRIAIEESKELAVRKRMGSLGLIKLTKEDIDSIDRRIDQLSKVIPMVDQYEMAADWQNIRVNLGLDDRSFASNSTSSRQIIV